MSLRRGRCHPAGRAWGRPERGDPRTNTLNLPTTTALHPYNNPYTHTKSPILPPFSPSYISYIHTPDSTTTPKTTDRTKSFHKSNLSSFFSFFWGFFASLDRYRRSPIGLVSSRYWPGKTLRAGEVCRPKADETTPMGGQRGREKQKNPGKMSDERTRLWRIGWLRWGF